MAEQVLKVISGCYSTHFMVLRYIVNFSRRGLILWVLEKILLSISYLFSEKSTVSMRRLQKKVVSLIKNTTVH